MKRMLGYEARTFCAGRGWGTQGLRGVVLACALAVAVGGCDRGLSKSDLDANVKQLFEQQLELDVNGITCPPKMPIEEGASYTCDVEVKSGGTVPVTVAVVDAKGNARITLGGVVFVPKKFARRVGDELTRRGKMRRSRATYTVDCGTEVKIVKPGMSFECSWKDSAKRSGKIVVSADDKGQLSWKKR